MLKRTVASALLSATILLSAIPVSAVAEEDKGIVILHTNDVHCDINATDDTFGYADLAAYRAKLESEGYTTILVDAGDYVQGGVVGTLSDGSYIIDIMNKLNYNVAVPGNHEFDYGMDRFYELVDMAEFDIISSNFISLETGKSVLDGSKVIEVDGVKLGFVGMTTSDPLAGSAPAYFQNDKGEFIYSFCPNNNGEELYSIVQAEIDEVKAQGAEYVIAIGHLGIDMVESSPWTSYEVIANTSGIDMFIDAHSHSVVEGEIVKSKNGENVLLSSTGLKFNNIGAVTISGGDITAELISKDEYTVTDNTYSDEYKAYKEMSAFIDDIESKYNELVETIVAKTDVTLSVYDPEAPKARMVRYKETNLGDLCADAYRTMLGADIGFVNGGGIRAEIAAGDITYGQIISVHPFGNEACLVEASGQEILDALELSAFIYPEESGGFLQVSGLSYELHSYIPSSVKTSENGEFISVDGEYRVKNVLVGGKPLDLNKTYTVASHNYMLLNGGDGYVMFADNNVLLDCVMIDNRVLIDYIVDELGGVVGEKYSDPYGDGRIVIVSEQPDGTSGENGDENPNTGIRDYTAAIPMTALAVLVAICMRKKQNA